MAKPMAEIAKKRPAKKLGTNKGGKAAKDQVKETPDNGSIVNEEDAVAPIDPEMKKLIADDKTEYVFLLKEYNEALGEIRQSLQPLLTDLESEEYPMGKGITFLDAKIQLMIGYCVNLAFLMLMKSTGTQLNSHAVIMQLVELRTFLEKVRPLDQKLRYQIDKLVKTAVSHEVGSAMDPLRFKPNIDNMTQDEAGEGVAGDEPGTGVYVPPRISAVHFDDGNKMDKLRKKDARLARDLRDHDLYQDLKSQYTDEPVELKDQSRYYDTDAKEKAERDAKRRYEEENMTRLMETKKDKQARKKQKFRNELTDITDFGKISKLAKVNSKPTEDFGILKKKKLLKEYMSDQKGGSQRGGGAQRGGRGGGRGRGGR
eukprot:Ihof_evm1s457 gene=Ihof_evmTU1s457